MLAACGTARRRTPSCLSTPLASSHAAGERGNVLAVRERPRLCWLTVAWCVQDGGRAHCAHGLQPAEPRRWCARGWGWRGKCRWRAWVLLPWVYGRALIAGALHADIMMLNSIYNFVKMPDLANITLWAHNDGDFGGMCVAGGACRFAPLPSSPHPNAAAACLVQQLRRNVLARRAPIGPGVLDHRHAG